MKKIVTLICLFLAFTLTSFARVYTVGWEYHFYNDTVTLHVEADEPWVIVETWDGINWEVVTDPIDESLSEFTFPVEGLSPDTRPYPFHIAIPAKRVKDTEDNGNHLGWYRFGFNRR